MAPVASEFSIPRARPAKESRLLAGGGKKPLRSPSGRSMTASEFLGGYRPKPRGGAASSGGEEAVERYYVPLKN